MRPASLSLEDLYKPNDCSDCLTSGCCLCRNRDLNDMPMKLDLHGLHVHEAIAQLKKTIHEWQASPESMRMSALQNALIIARFTSPDADTRRGCMLG